MARTTPTAETIAEARELKRAAELHSLSSPIRTNYLLEAVLVALIGPEPGPPSPRADKLAALEAATVDLTSRVEAKLDAEASGVAA